jgi:uncharacterized membrane protein YczE
MTWICFSWVKRTLHDWLRILIGLLIYSFGVYLTIYANIGLAPWDCLGMGIANCTPLSYGSVMVLIGVAAIIIQLLMKERIGFATVFDALLTGNLVQCFLSGSTNLRSQSIWLNICFMLAGFLLISVGTWVYMRAEMGCGPKDGLLIAIGKRLPKIPIGVVEILLWAVVTVFGWLLGGTVGIGTVISVFVGGAVMHLFFDVIGFEPRKLEHKSLTESLTQLFKKV